MKKFLALILAMILIIAAIPFQTLAYTNDIDTVWFIGQAHQDTMWLWDEPDTVQQVITTTERAIEAFKAHPEYKITYPASYHYEHLRWYRPDLYQQVKDYIASGNWEAVGGMWVEPDINIAGGESAIRNIIFGKQYANDVMKAKESRAAYMPDTFGHTGSYPQIMKKSGFDYYYMTKNDQQSGKIIRYPGLFNWISKDGSSIPVLNGHSYTLGSPTNIGVSLNTLNDIMNFFVNGKNNENPAVSLTGGMVFRDAPRTFGDGDRGGGPSAYNVQQLKNLRSANLINYPDVQFSSLAEYFAVIEKKGVIAALNPASDVKEEVYHENRRGIYSNDAAGKYMLRKNESRAEEAEKFAAVADWLGYADYQADKLKGAYKLLAKETFHDCLYGTHMTVPPMERHISEHGLIANMFDDSLSYSLYSLASNINTSAAAGGIPVIVFNALSYVRNDVAEATVQFASVPAFIKVSDAAGNEVLSQITGVDGNSVSIIFEANNVPSVGYKLYKVEASTTPSSLTSPLTVTTTGSGTTTARVLANNTLSATIAYNGTISELALKDGNVNLVNSAANPMNELQYMADTGIARDLTRAQIKVATPQRLNTTVEAQNPMFATIIESGPVRSVIRLKKMPITTGTHSSSGRSDITVDYILYSNSDRIDIISRANWDETNRMLKTAFYTAFSIPTTGASAITTYEQPYGVEDRTYAHQVGTSNTPKFEVAGHKWATISGTISGDTYGISILNAGKYGWDLYAANCLRLTLLRSPTASGSGNTKNREAGYYEDTYSIYPHKGTWASARTHENAQALNLPLRAYVTDVHTGDLANSYSFVGVDKANIQLSVVKQSEGKEGSRNDPEGWTTIRLYETNGAASTPVTVTFDGTILDAKETDLIEVVRGTEGPVSFAQGGRTLSTTLTAFELKTFMVKLAPSGKTGSSFKSKVINLPFTEVGITTKENAALGDIDGKGWSLPAMDFPGTISNSGVKFEFGAADQNNIIRPTDQIINVGGTGYKTLNFIAASTIGTNRSAKVDVTLKYSDGSSAKSAVYVRDLQTVGLVWNQPVLPDVVSLIIPYRHRASGGPSNDGYDRANMLQIYEYSVPVDSTKELESVSFLSSTTDAKFGKPFVMIFAATASDKPVYNKVDGTDVVRALPSSGLPRITSTKLEGMTVQGSIEFGVQTDPVTVLCALYSADNKLLEVSTDDGMPAWGINNYTFEFTKKAAYAKLFVWHGETFVPLCESSQANFTYPNVALFKNTDCNSRNNDDQKCSQLVNGVYSNKWCTAANVGDAGFPSLWAVIDLGANYSIKKWAVQHAQAGGEGASYNTRTFTVQVSIDGVNFYTLDSIVNNTAASTSRDIDLVFRYFKFDATQPVQSNGGRACCRIPAIELFGELYEGNPASISFSGLTAAPTHTPRHMGLICP